MTNRGPVGDGHPGDPRLEAGTPAARQGEFLLPLLLLVLAVLVGAPAALAAPPCTLPPEDELGRLDPPWEEAWALQEKWIWARTLAGEVADLDRLYCQKL